MRGKSSSNALYVVLACAIAQTACLRNARMQYSPPAMTDGFNEGVKRDYTELNNVVLSRQGGDFVMKLTALHADKANGLPGLYVLGVSSTAKAARLEDPTHVEMQIDGETFALGDWRRTQNIVMGGAAKYYVEAVAGEMPADAVAKASTATSVELVLGTVRVALDADAKRWISDLHRKVSESGVMSAPAAVAAAPEPPPAAPEPVAAPAEAPPVKPSKKKR